MRIIGNIIQTNITVVYYRKDIWKTPIKSFQTAEKLLKKKENDLRCFWMASSMKWENSNQRTIVNFWNHICLLEKSGWSVRGGLLMIPCNPFGSTTGKSTGGSSLYTLHYWYPFKGGNVQHVAYHITNKTGKSRSC